VGGLLHAHILKKPPSCGSATAPTRSGHGTSRSYLALCAEEFLPALSGNGYLQAAMIVAARSTTMNHQHMPTTLDQGQGFYATASAVESSWVLHSDNGSPMKGATMLANPAKGWVLVLRFSRPSVSDDNPYSEGGCSRPEITVQRTLQSASRNIGQARAGCNAS